ncbi:MAG: hypothetical protein JKY65_31795 [Planctomycetes bacterium]|nr:hypothetical protein [Planctomycetota bacterium]
MRQPVKRNETFWIEPTGLDGWDCLTPGQRRSSLALLRLGVGTEIPTQLRHSFAECSFAPWGATLLADLYPDALSFLAWVARHESWGMHGVTPLTQSYLRSAYTVEGRSALVHRALGGAQGCTFSEPARMIRFLAEELCRPRWFRFADQPSPSARQMLGVLRRLGGQAHVRDLHLIFATWTPAQIRDARHELAERLFLFNDLDPESLDLCLGMLKLHRGDIA